MSERPRRNPKPIQRIQNEQAMVAAKPKTMRKSRTTVAAKPKTTRKPRTTKTVQQVNKSLRGRIYRIFNSLRKTNRIDNKRIFNFLFSYYKDADDKFLSRTFDGKTDDFIRNALIKQYDIMKNNDKSRNSGYVRQIKIKFNDTNLKDFVMMMYLDMYHDKTFTGTLTEFTKSGIPSELLGEKNSNKLIGDTELKLTMIKEGIFNLKTDKPMSEYEKKMKYTLAPTFGLKEPYIFNQSVNLSNYAKDKGKPIYVSIDAESKKSTFSLLITQSKFKNGFTQRKFVKSIISIPNRVDPGNLMPTGGGAQEYNRLFNFTRNNSTRSTQLYDFCDYIIYFHNTKIILKSRLEEQTEPFYLSLNGVEYPIGASAKKGQNNTGTRFKISKFLGDFLQIIVTAKSNNTFVATQDGMCSGMTAFMFKNTLNTTPRLFIEYAFPQGNKFAVYGAEDMLKRDPNQNRNVTNILTGHSSGGSTVSSNNSNNNNTQSKLSNITNSNSNINTLKRRRNTNNTNRKKPRFLGRIFGGNNTSSTAGSSRGSVSRNNNNNNVTSNNQRGQKRVRNNNTNVNQPPAKKINVTRNRLIQNLKKKNLPNFVINGLVKSYDNKQKTVNQIIREANNFSKTFTMGKTAQRKSTLRKR